MGPSPHSSPSAALIEWVYLLPWRAQANRARYSLYVIFGL
ncbi:hypothetical protein HMPREF0742_00355 [Rothia aeria F0184]|uniref:Uncharacterized protein n=1 Tax=Rothia aeria F0184 TaxID=888019 RepID=U7V7B7_9MICC|nr:hypothetical protein HMPREF0742_00355 [Rothia aeria F0184]